MPKWNEGIYLQDMRWGKTVTDFQAQGKNLVVIKKHSQISGFHIQTQPQLKQLEEALMVEKSNGGESQQRQRGKEKEKRKGEIYEWLRDLTQIVAFTIVDESS